MKAITPKFAFVCTIRHIKNSVAKKKIFMKFSLLARISLGLKVYVNSCKSPIKPISRLKGIFMIARK